MSDTITGTLNPLSNLGPLLSNQDSPLVCLDLGHWPIAWSGADLVTEIGGSAEPMRSAMRKVPILLIQTILDLLILQTGCLEESHGHVLAFTHIHYHSAKYVILNTMSYGIKNLIRSKH